MSLSKPVQPAVPQNDSVAHALAGAGGGTLSLVLTYPLVTLSTRAQVEFNHSHATFLTAVRRILAREGVPGLYAGLSSALIGISLTNFVYYYWFEWTRFFFAEAAAARGRAKGGLTTAESMMAGAIAGSATVIVTNPIWVINTRMTTCKHESVEPEDGGSRDQKTDTLPGPAALKRARPSTMSTLLTLLRKEGPQALFAGLVPGLVLVINPILQYTLFEQMKNLLERRRGPGYKTTATAAFFLGALGKLFATTVTYPYITVKSRMHVAPSPSDGDIGRQGVIKALSRVVREEGWQALYKGVTPKLTQSVIAAAFLFAFKDALYAQSVQLRRTMAGGESAVTV